MRDKLIWEQTESSFIQHYYQLFDKDRTQVGTIYIDASCLMWEGQQFQGKTAIVEKLSSLLFQKMKVDEDPITGFHQMSLMFLLKNISEAWVCTNDMFRLALLNFG
uniref:NTF2 domain-containing protein n=1 Tax=Mandrillus leucophaeus TaxID=9568 RepID=A0A2K6AEZ1_MANLE